MELHGFDMYDSQARWQYSLIPRFSTIDPLAEKYYHISPYAYCAGDPVNLVDPDGRKIRVTGDQQNTTLKVLEDVYGGKLNFDDDGYIIIIEQTDSKNSNSKLIAEIINNENIIVDLWTTNGKLTQDGVLFCGGAFMGSETEYSEGQKQVHTYQTVNLNVLQKVDEHGGYRGRSLMHELSESYYGGIYAYDNNLNTVEPAYLISENNVYKYAHKKAVKTSPVRLRLFDKHNVEVFDISDCNKAIWYVEYNYRTFPIQTFP